MLNNQRELVTFSIEHILLKFLTRLFGVRLRHVEGRRSRQQVLRHAHRVVLQVVADRQVQVDGNSQLAQVVLGTDAGEHEDARRLYGPRGEDHFVARLHAEVVAILGHLDARRSTVLHRYL